MALENILNLKNEYEQEAYLQPILIPLSTKKHLAHFTYTGDFIESRIDQIFGHGAQIGF